MTATTTPCVLTQAAAALRETAARVGISKRCVPAEEMASRKVDQEHILVLLLVGREMPFGDRSHPHFFTVSARLARFGWRFGTVDLWLFTTEGRRFGKLTQVAVAPFKPREVLLAALAARWAAIEGDYETVDNFTRKVLGRVRPELWREGVVDALLGDWVEHLGGYLTDPELTRILREYAEVERRRWHPLWERRAGHSRLLMAGAAIGDGLVLEDLFSDRRTAEDRALEHLLGDERVRSVLRRLKAEEKAVAALWAQGAGTWAEAALRAGLPETYGDRVRRKLHRLGAQQVERAGAVAVAR
ncbi:hypothetical protein OG689_42995 [Kitasatospora sp. NBC_00240]|uniref:hypothetical protein n=1 Tax=Kitasatospora sp. NBC_00240 TaxID=2903567 RepID=UPI002258AA91|nr:hypothetical protein [Kitasatospora sp. NBC_00240]MCX5215912.1 hypothetical protein [Kitasatospora sp. NBC_00240]